MKVAITGGNGFIGSHVVESLRLAGHELTVLDISPPRADVDWAGVRYVRGSFLEEDALDAALDGMDCVVHSASTSVPSTSMANPVADVEQNLLGTLRIVQSMVRRRVPRIVYLSSGGTVYGVTSGEPVDEQHPCMPISGYGIVKLACEHYLRVLSRTHGFSSLSLRASNPYGPRQAGSGVQGLIGTVMHRLRKGLPIDIRGDGSAVRDYLYIEDMADAVTLAVASPLEGVVNIGSGTGLSVLEVVRAVEQAMGVVACKRFGEASTSDVPRIVLDCRKAASELKWAPRTTFELGVRTTASKLSEMPS